MCFIVGTFKRCLIDGGQGQKSTALKQNHCIIESTTLNPPVIRNDTITNHLELDLIVITHPDKDHCGGINRLLKPDVKDEKLTVCCPIITTLAARLSKHEGENYESKEGDCPHFWFPVAPGRKHTLPEKSIVQICHNEKFEKKQKNFDCNATSILTTVQIPGSTYDYDVVLTGDSYGGIILKNLGLMLKPSSSQERTSQVDSSELNPSQKTTTSKHQVLHQNSSERKTVGVFQVPHHGSKVNSSKANSTKESKKCGGGSVQKSKEFYLEFDADIYLISHGDRYEHPHSEVITGILAAAVQKKQHCKIIVTAAWFEGTKIIDTIDTNISKWRDYVDIYYFPPYVTLDPNDVKLPEGLQLYNKKVHTIFQSNKYHKYIPV